MPSIVTATELRNILGVSSSLYNDTYLNDILDASEGVILPMLVSYSAPVIQHERINNVAYLYFQKPHPFVVGQSVTVTNVGAQYNGTNTLTDVGDYWIAYASVHANEELHNVIPSGLAKLQGSIDYVGNSNVEAAVLTVAVEIFQSRVAPGGQIEGVDFSSTPFRMGRSLFNKCVGLLGSLLDVETLAQ